MSLFTKKKKEAPAPEGVPAAPAVSVANAGTGADAPAATPKKATFNFNSMFLHVPLQEKVLFARHIAVAIKSGMTLSEGLKLVLTQTKSKSFKKILTTI